MHPHLSDYGLLWSLHQLAPYLDTALLAAGVMGEAGAVGVDIESTTRLTSLDIARKILAPEERARFGSDDQLGAVLTPERELLVCFSVKEALYKALHPLLRQTIRWHSVQVHPQEGGACTVCIGELLDAVSIPLVAEAAWCVRDGYFVSTAAASVARHQPQALTRQPSSRSPRRGASG